MNNPAMQTPITEIGKLKIGGTPQTLTPGAGNDTTPIALGGTADVKAREVAAI